MAQERYGFFDSSGGDIRSYNSVDMATAFHTLASNGVANLGACLQVTAEGSTMRTLVGYGTAMIEGYYYRLRDDGSGVRAFTHTTEAELSRIDRIVLRLDLTTRTIAIVKLIGTAGSTPEAPALTRDDETYEISLAQVYIRAAATELFSIDITDERDDDDVCGLIAPESLRQSAVEALIAAAIDAATEDVIRYSAQTLESGQKTQTRTNIDAMKKVGGSTALQKGDGDGDTEDAVPDTDYAPPAIHASGTLVAASWSGSEAPYTQTVSITGMTAAKKATVGLPATATSAQYIAALAALLHVTTQGAGTITVAAEGDMPEIDIPVLVFIMGG